ncbi:Conserved_hypothetical protein [Hexamita inflata]|uniref:Uncharacterized protein n=1 Tax=Hexamita inflata TaxID=28002 RepID=A0AA86QX57_9EUKA|nr:Conserved hypothetical protein [Hexamita inflata]
MIPRLNLDVIDLNQINKAGQKSTRDSARNFEHLNNITLSDMSSSLKFKICITISYMLATTDSYTVIQNINEIKTENKSLTGEFLQNIALKIKVKPDVLLQTIENIKDDNSMMNEIGQCAFGVLNYIDKKFQTSQIWDVPNIDSLFDDKILRDIESECLKIQKATPRGKLF